MGGKVKRKYELSKTPYQRLLESGQIRDEVKDELNAIYLSLNPARVKRNIDAKLDKLYETYAGKDKTRQVNPHKRLSPRSVTFYMIQRSSVGLPT
ncbi:unnamed protein product [marine sediment metagenome]|uniref:Uncharacterized protein n=1 Tax=marine sediment metagenome TaxID=412755 RepID=X1I7P9_9ZZZZ